MKHIHFKEVSHIETRTMSENKVIRCVMKGEEYYVWEYTNTYPEEDRKRKLLFSWKTQCVAKEDRWYSGDGTWLRTSEAVIKDWNNSVMYNDKEDKWYNRPWLKIHFLSGDTYDTFFDSDEEMTEEANRIMDDGVKTIGKEEE